MRKIIAFYKRCRESQSWFFVVMARYIYNRIFYNNNLFLHQGVVVKGRRNIKIVGKMEVGIDRIGFSLNSDKTLLNVNGKLLVNGDCYLRRGCRLDIGQNATMTIGDEVYINNNTSFIIMNKLSIGDGCAISWDCQILDEDFHEITYEGKKPVKRKEVLIGNNVWIGSGTKIYKGTVIPDGCVISANSIVRGEFNEENCLIGGHPAKVLKTNVSWQ